jgi:hypothetical protein
VVEGVGSRAWVWELEREGGERESESEQGGERSDPLTQITHIDTDTDTPTQTQTHAHTDKQTDRQSDRHATWRISAGEMRSMPRAL